MWIPLYKFQPCLTGDYFYTLLCCRSGETLANSRGSIGTFRPPLSIQPLHRTLLPLYDEDLNERADIIEPRHLSPLKARRTNLVVGDWRVLLMTLRHLTLAWGETFSV